MKPYLAAVFAALFCVLASCSSQTAAVLGQSGAADIQLKASLEPRMARLIRSFSGTLGDNSAGNSLDGPAIAESMKQAPGVNAVSFYNIDSTTIEGTLSVANVEDFLSLSSLPESSHLIHYTQGRQLSIQLDLASGPELLGALSPDVADYLSAIMAPVSTGERLSPEEYLELVRSVYNPGISEEIAGARIQARIEVPGTITRVQGGSFSGREARFDIALLDLLVLEKPILYEIEWR
ncbi:MAG: hypothetical protein LBH73_06750 [Spirochaetaceae bacterium]|jgi:hypothetical protein|nr:hypothetical protein [Spirochaetaceae bacterium]